MKTAGKHPKLSRQELKVLEWVEQGFKKDKGRIIVEPGYRSSFYNAWPDIVVISDAYGVLIFECKGHYSEQIRSISNTDILLKEGNEILRYGKQMAEYGCLVRELIVGTGVPIRKFVVFPEILTDDLAANAIKEFNTNHLDVMPIFNESLDWDLVPSLLELRELNKKLSADQLEILYERLNPTRIASQQYYLDLEGIHAKLSLLDESQMEVIDSIKDGHYLLNGLPGTGKTVILMKIAERELAKSKEVRITCYNKLLTEYLQRAFGKEIPKSTSQVYADLIKKSGSKTIDDKSFYKIYIRHLLTANIDPFLDVLLVDEYQDLDDEEYSILMKTLRPGGLLVLCGDRLQNIRGKGQTWKTKGIHIVGGNRSKFLRTPYRTSAAVVNFGIEFLSQKPSLREEAMAYFHENEYIHNQIDEEKLIEHVAFHLSSTGQFIEEAKAVRERNPEASILVIVHNPWVKNELNLLDKYKILVETYGRVKGIEADIVLIYNVDGYLSYENPHEKMSLEQKMKSVFSALCRARSQVHIHGLKDSDFYLDLKDSFNRCLKRQKTMA